ncbi:MAG: hypothetical protein ACRBFS_04435 [Aureispira sp.]
MSHFNHYKEKFWDYSNDELKDIIAERFGASSEEEIAAAMALLKERNNSKKEKLSLDQIPEASTMVLLDIIKNPSTWGEEAVAIAETEILHREQSTSNGNKTFFQGVLVVIGIIVSFLLLKAIAALLLIAFFIYSVRSCIGNL